MNLDQKQTLAAIFVTLVALVLALVRIGSHIGGGVVPSLAAVLASLLLCALAYGGVVHLVARWGFLRREAAHPQAEPVSSDQLYAAKLVPPVCVLVPSYQEQPRRVRQAVISAALAEYPSRRIVVLIDDDPAEDGADAEATVAMQREVRRMQLQFRRAAEDFQAERTEFLARTDGGRSMEVDQEARRLVKVYQQLALWVESLAQSDDDGSLTHVDQFFNEQIIGRAADMLRERAGRLSDSANLGAGRVLFEYRRLASMLELEISSFERKRYVNLSHEPGRAMNLNGYIALLGRRFTVSQTPQGQRLQECQAGQADLAVPQASFLLVLDADSVVKHDYLHKLASVMMADRRVALAQAPYCAFPGAPELVEYVAGAQTDLRYITHQGLGQLRAGYWVGTNALLRAEALHDVRRSTRERGQEFAVFIQNKTVIENAGVSLDLVRRGWKLHTHPERLAYSAAPADFGALVIQRRRWASGALIVLGDLLRYVQRPRGKRPGVVELLLRAQPLCAPALSSLGVLLLALVLLLQGQLANSWMLLVVLPYFVLYGQDLRRCGYGWVDLLRVYVLRLMLLPVQLAGVSASLRQAVTGRKPVFERTPKVDHRTAAPALHVMLQFAMLFAAIAAAQSAWSRTHFFLGVFFFFNAGCLVYGLRYFIGLQEAMEDLASAVPWPGTRARSRRRRESVAEAASEQSSYAG